MSRTVVYVSGVGAVAPGGADWKSHLSSLYAGRSLVRPQPSLDVSGLERTVGARADVVLPHARPRYAELALLVANEALAMSGEIAPEVGNLDAVVGATAIAATLELEETFRRGRSGAGLFDFDIATNLVADAVRFGGPRFTQTTGCTASLDALGLGFRLVRSGACQRVLVVAADATLSPIVVAAFQKIGALSTRECPAEQASAPFSLERDGFVLGEGAAAVLLESESHLLARGGTALAEVAGWASVSSALHMTALREDGTDVARAMEQALADAGVGPERVDVFDAHGTSTPMNDRSEAAAYRRVFGTGGRVAVTAQKGVTGHSLGASNLMEVAGVIGFLRDQRLAPVANLSAANLAEDVPVVMGEARPSEVKCVVKVSSGFSGIHTATVLRAVA